MCNLAVELNVSYRTIQRDILEIELFIPLKIKRGKYGGGVEIQDTYSYDRMYMNEDEIYLLNKILILLTSTKELGFSTVEIDLLSRIIQEYSMSKS